MLVHSENFKREIKKFGRQLDSKIIYDLDGERIELGGEELNSITPSFQSNILKSAMKQLDIDSNVDIPLETIINYKFGVMINDNYEYLDFGNYIVYSSEKQEDTNSYKIICYDLMLRSMIEYTEMQNVTFPMTIREYITNLCNNLSLEFENENTSFVNSDQIMPSDVYANLGYTYRDIFDELAQVTASTICINKNNKVEIRYIKHTGDRIDEEFLKDINVNFGKKYGPVNSIVLSRAGGSDNVYIQDEESVEENGLNEIKISDNQIMNGNDRSDYLPGILDELDGLEYHLNDFASTGICYYEICDNYDVDIDGKTYSCIAFNDEIEITQGLVENIYTDLPEDSETDYTKADKTDQRINQAYIIVDKQNQRIDQLAEKVVPVSNTITGNNSVTLENAHEGLLYNLEFYGDISLHFPSDSLPKYPSEELYPKDTYLLVDDIKYKLDFDFLNYINESVHDTFIYQNGECWIERNVGVDEYGNMYKLPKTIIEKRKNIQINVKEDSIIKLESFDNAKYKTTYLLQNEYTDTFATEAYVKSEIQVTADGINQEVSKKVGNDEIISRINQSPETISIESNKISLEGKEINLTGDNINIESTNFKVDASGNMTCRNANVIGGEINLFSNDEESSKFIIKNRENGDITWKQFAGGIIWTNDSTNSRVTFANSLTPYLIMQHNDGRYINVSPLNLTMRNSLNNETIKLSSSDGNITCVTLTQTSREENKKNFELYDGALETIKDIDIYKYNLINEDDDSKKHIGVVIGDKFKCSTDILSVNENGEAVGVDTYSMTSLCLKAIKEQQEIIEELKDEIKKLKESE